MNNHDELKEKYKALSEVKIPDELRERVHKMIDEVPAATPSAKNKRRKPIMWMRSVAAAVACIVVFGGVYSLSQDKTLTKNSAPSEQLPFSHQQASQQYTQAAPTWGFPGNIAWNGYYYDTKGFVTTVGSKIGTATYPGAMPVYSVLRKNPEQEIAIKVEVPDNPTQLHSATTMKYILAVRADIKKEPSWIIANDWMTLDGINPDHTMHAGDVLNLSGTVIFRELYGTTVQMGLRERKDPTAKYIVTQTFHVSQHGTISGQITIPKNLSAPKNTEYVLVFREQSHNIATNSFVFPLIFK